MDARLHGSTLNSHKEETGVGSLCWISIGRMFEFYPFLSRQLAHIIKHHFYFFFGLIVSHLSEFYIVDSEKFT